MTTLAAIDIAVRARTEKFNGDMDKSIGVMLKVRGAVGRMQRALGMIDPAFAQAAVGVGAAYLAFDALRTRMAAANEVMTEASERMRELGLSAEQASGGLFNEEQLKAVEDMNRAMEKAGDQIDRVFGSILAEAAPVVEGASLAFADLASVLDNEVIGYMTELGLMLDPVTKGLILMAESYTSIREMFVGAEPFNPLDYEGLQKSSDVLEKVRREVAAFGKTREQLEMSSLMENFNADKNKAIEAGDVAGVKGVFEEYRIKRDMLILAQNERKLQEEGEKAAEEKLKKEREQFDLEAQRNKTAKEYLESLARQAEMAGMTTEQVKARLAAEQDSAAKLSAAEIEIAKRHRAETEEKNRLKEIQESITEELKRQSDEYAKMDADAKRLTDSLKTPYEEAHEAAKEYLAFLESGRITQEQFDQLTGKLEEDVLKKITTEIEARAAEPELKLTNAVTAGSRDATAAINRFNTGAGQAKNTTEEKQYKVELDQKALLDQMLGELRKANQQTAGEIEI